jgi:hypothetical protein
VIDSVLLLGKHYKPEFQLKICSLVANNVDSDAMVVTPIQPGAISKLPDSLPEMNMATLTGAVPTLSPFVIITQPASTSHVAKLSLLLHV